MREGWKEVTIGDISSLITKGTTPSTYGFDFEENGEINFIRAEGISKDGRIDSSTFLKISSECNLKLKRSIIHENDILFSIAGMALGKSGIVKSEYLPANTNQAVSIIRPNDKVMPKFLLYYIANPSFYTLVNSVSGQAAQPNINLKQVASLPINLPPLETQKKIASILSGYDDLIENNLKRIKILEEMAQQTYEEWFVRMRFPGHQSTTINPETGLSEGWKQCRMGEILNFTNGFAFKSKDYVENGVYSIVTIKNVQEGYFENSKFDKILEIPSKVKESQRLNTGDLVMSLTGNVGRLCFVYGENLLLNQRVCKIDCKAIGFVYCTLRSSYFKNKIENLANGAAQQNLSTIDMENLIIDFPKNELIDDFESFVNPIFNSILNLNIQNQRLREARDILLPRLMMGMVEV